MFNLGVLLFSVSILLPFNFRNTPFIIFSLVTLYFFCKPKLNNQKEYLKILIVNTLYFVFMMISISYTDNFSEGAENLLSISPMLIMPLTFYAVFTRNNVKKMISQNKFYELFFISTMLFFSLVVLSLPILLFLLDLVLVTGFSLLIRICSSALYVSINLSK